VHVTGKSSLIKILFRLGPLHGVAPSSGGYAFIDGIDISTLKLAAVRKALGYVPQSPITFAGTLYENFYKDSTNASEAAACKILAACGLSKIATLDALGQQMASLNLTEGEVQLLAAAKALVKKPQVVVLDEATSALGQVAADHLIRVIDHEAADATVLSIAHRIKAVLHYDRILVLKHGGKVDAFDTPAALKQQDGYFAR
jgi:ATP-binding cassette subfamily C (CFTR/MRP) protein 1